MHRSVCCLPWDSHLGDVTALNTLKYKASSLIFAQCSDATVRQACSQNLFCLSLLRTRVIWWQYSSIWNVSYEKILAHSCLIKLWAFFAHFCWKKYSMIQAWRAIHNRDCLRVFAIIFAHLESMRVAHWARRNQNQRDTLLNSGFFARLTSPTDQSWSRSWTLDFIAMTPNWLPADYFLPF